MEGKWRGKGFVQAILAGSPINYQVCWKQISQQPTLLIKEPYKLEICLIEDLHKNVFELKGCDKVMAYKFHNED